MLELTLYYCNFISAYSDLVRPQTQLTHKAVPFSWTDNCQKSFEILKQLLVSSPILVYANPNKGYTLFIDASNMPGLLFKYRPI